MARKDILVHKILTDQSLAADFVTDPTVINYLDNIAYQINVLTSDSTGTFIVQASVDYKVSTPGTQIANPGNWVDLPLSGTPVVSGADDSILINLNQLPFSAVRLKYVSDTAGTGTCEAYIEAKQIGG